MVDKCFYLPSVDIFPIESWVGHIKVLVFFLVFHLVYITAWNFFLLLASAHFGEHLIG